MKSNFDSRRIETLDGNVEHTLVGWLVTFLILSILLVYLWSFWLVASMIKPWWVNNLFTFWDENDQVMALWLSIWVVMGMIVPAVFLLLSGFRLKDVGIDLPNIVGYRMVLLGVALSVPFGFLLVINQNHYQVQKVFTPSYLMSLLSMVPEHFLVAGVCTALMLPGRRLPNPIRFAQVEGSLFNRVFRWFGLAQPSRGPLNKGVLIWFGLTGVSLFAIIASGVVFRVIHLGKDDLEMILSLPGGFAIAYMTLRSHSVWPSVIAHWSLNLIPLGFLAIFR